MEEKKTIYDNIKDIHDWRKYAPIEPQYIKFKTNVIFAGIKIFDLYFVLSTARANLHYSDMNDYGNLSSKDDLSILFVRFGFIEKALIYYNIAVDMSWQIPCLFYNAHVEDLLPTDTLYQDCLKQGNYDLMLYRLALAKDYKVKEYALDFFERNSTYKFIRQQYNYMKHRGTFYVEGMGENDSELNFSYNSMKIPKVKRLPLDLKKERKILEDFDLSFTEYCENIFSMLMPSDYLNMRYDPFITVQYVQSHIEEIKSYNEKKAKKG